MTIPEQFHDIFEGRSFANIATVLPNGAPHVVPVWVGYDGEYVLTSGGQDHRRHRNMKQDPRVSLNVWNAENPYRVILVHGEVEAMIEDGLEFHDERARSHWNVDEYPFNRQKDRYLVKIRPERVVDTSTSLPKSYEP